MENDRKLRVCAGTHSVGRLWKKWIGNVKDKSEWRGFVRGSEWGVARGMNP